MAEPTEKAPEIAKLLEKVAGRTTKIKADECVFCVDPDMDFRDEISKREYRISGLCQRCQDKVFGGEE